MERQNQVTANQSTILGRPRTESLQNRADEVLIAIAILGLVATVSDGQADAREIDNFTQTFKKRFAISKRVALKIMSIAVRRIRFGSEENLIACACDTLNVYLDTQQRLDLFDNLAEILVADGIVHNDEEYFLDYVAQRLHLVDALTERFPSR